MDQSPVAAEAPAVDESAALENLKARISDKTYPTLSLSGDLAAHLKSFSQTHESLAGKLGMIKRRPWLSQVLGLLDLPELTRTNLEGRCLSTWDLKKLSQNRPPQTSTKTSTTDSDTSTTSTRPSTTSTDAENNELNVSTDRSKGDPGGSTDDDRIEAGFPLIRDTVNGWAKLLWWVKDAEFGELMERWLILFRRTGWFMVGLRVLLAGFTLCGAYQVTHFVYTHAGDFWFRFKTAAYPSLSESGATGPHIYDAHPIAGHRLEMKWNAVPGALKYRVYWHTQDGSSIQPLGQDVDTLGAVVDVSPAWKEGYLSVAAIGTGDIQSPHTEKVPFVPNGENYTDTVDRLPISEQANGTANPYAENGGMPKQRDTQSSGKAEGSAKGSPVKEYHSPPLRASRPSAPVEVHADVRTPDLIRLTWRAVGKGYTYNAYSSASRELTALRKENDQPLKTNVVEWTPETGLERYWVVVTAVDASGRESVYSEAIEVVRHPDKSGSNGMIDAAAGAVRRFVPW